jgi:hypothetical protein
MKLQKRRVVSLTLAVCTVCAIFAVAAHLIRRNACTSEVLKVAELSGVKFEVESSSCDVIAKDEAVSVYAMKATKRGIWPFSSWGNRKTLVFRYDPGRDDNPLPSITRPSQSIIRISIPEISSIAVQNREWDNISISYEIGKVDYPTKSN